LQLFSFIKNPSACEAWTVYFFICFKQYEQLHPACPQGVQALPGKNENEIQIVLLNSPKNACDIDQKELIYMVGYCSRNRR